MVVSRFHVSYLQVSFSMSLMSLLVTHAMGARSLASPSSTAGPSNGEGSSSARPISPSTHAQPSGHIYCAVRDLSGVIGYITSDNPVPPPNTRLSLGEVVNSYLRMQGFTASALRQIADAYTDADTIDAFVHILCSEGMSQLEVEWIWNHIV